jgi:PadR family transcriptional regulator PadR
MEPGEAQFPLTQLRRGVIEYCVLSLLTEEELYGFDLVRRLSEAEGIVTSEGTIYPLLSRLRKVGWVSTTWSESAAGPPRRYYEITKAGRHALTGFCSDWQRFRDSVDGLLGTGARDGSGDD